MRDIENYTKKYMENEFEYYQVIYRRKKVLEILNKYKPRRILEIGCGLEPLFKYLEQESYDEYTVIEPSALFVENARKEKGKKGNIKIIHDFFGEDVVNQLEEYDMILCSGLLHEIRDAKKFLECIYKVCNKNTIVHVNVANAKSFHRLLAKEMGIIANEYEMSEKNIFFQQHHVFDIESLSNLVLDCQFTILEKGSYFVKPFTHDQMFQMIKNGIIDEKVLNGLYNMTALMPELGSEIFVNCKII